MSSDALTQRKLSEADIDPNPIRQFARWFAEAKAAKLTGEANAMTLATSTPDGVPSARIVLLKSVSEGDFVFFTDYRSQKGQELTDNPRAALVFHWPEMERQVRITGTVSRASQEESAKYFASRALGSRLSALASHQSQVIPDRTMLEQRVTALTEQYRAAEPTRPDYWGGFRVTPITIEFWQGRANRLHDRLRYTRQSNGAWNIERLSP